jgi:hypothetical protein
MSHFDVEVDLDVGARYVDAACGFAFQHDAGNGHARSPHRDRQPSERVACVRDLRKVALLESGIGRVELGKLLDGGDAERVEREPFAHAEATQIDVRAGGVTAGEVETEVEPRAGLAFVDEHWLHQRLSLLPCDLSDLVSEPELVVVPVHRGAFGLAGRAGAGEGLELRLGEVQPDEHRPAQFVQAVRADDESGRLDTVGQAPGGFEHPPVVRQLEVVVEPRGRLGRAARQLKHVSGGGRQGVAQQAACPHIGDLVRLDVTRDVAGADAQQEVGLAGASGVDVVGQPPAEDHVDFVVHGPDGRLNLGPLPDDIRQVHPAASRQHFPQPGEHLRLESDACVEAELQLRRDLPLDRLDPRIELVVHPPRALLRGVAREQDRSGHRSHLITHCRLKTSIPTSRIGRPAARAAVACGG